MGRIKLDTPIEVKPPVVTNEVRDAQITINSDSINVRLDWNHQEHVAGIPAGGPTLVHQEHYSISGADFDELMGAKITPAHVGKKFWAILRRGIRNKVKELKALQGTVEDDD